MSGIGSEISPAGRGSRNLGLGIVIPAYIAGAAFLSGLAIGVLTYLQAADTLEEETSVRLTALVDARAGALTDYLESIRQDLVIQAESPFVLDALNDFSQGWAELGGDAGARLQKTYIDDNPNPTGEKDKLVDPKDGTAYGARHAAHHPWFWRLQRDRGYYDVFLVNRQGDLVYTVFKELDYATNLLTGKYKDTGLGKVVQAALKAKSSESLREQASLYGSRAPRVVAAGNAMRAQPAATTASRESCNCGLGRPGCGPPRMEHQTQRTVMGSHQT